MCDQMNGDVIEIHDLVKRFDDKVAVDHLDLNVQRARYSDSWDPTVPGRPRP